MSSSLKILHRSAAELLACTVLEVFPNTKLIRGYSTDIGFAYEFVFPQTIDDHDISLIEEKMRMLLKKNLPIKLIEMMRDNAAEFFRHHGQEIFAEHVVTAPSNVIELFHVEGFHGYSPAPYIKNTKEIGACKLLGFSQRKQLFFGKDSYEVTRIEGVAFSTTKELKKFLKRYEEAEKRDHQRLGPELELFTRQDEAGPGCWYWLPKGAIIREILLDLYKTELRKRGYDLVSTPRIVSKDFLASSRFHLPESQNLAEISVCGRPYLLATDLTPMHVQLYQTKRRSYRELPLKLAEIAEVYSPIKPNDLCGLFRSRLFTTDAAHCFCSENIAQEELISSLQFIGESINMFRIECKWYLVSKKPKTNVTKAYWDQGVELAEKAIKHCGFDFTIDTDQVSIGGPKIEARLVDALGREWPGPSVQVSLFPKETTLQYRGSDDQMHRPIVIASALFGSLERFVAILIEKHGGFFPLWLAPEQVRVIPVMEHHLSYSETVWKQLQQQGIRASIDKKNDTLAAKVYAAKRAKVPYVVIVGDTEKQNGTIAVRPFQDQGKGRKESVDAFVESIQKEIDESA
ncbi:MAG: Threonine--tRNA ligase [Chlamydiae bacterium]|nr:Threonine--tRNA ligase [Chlamydiota bacterium]